MVDVLLDTTYLLPFLGFEVTEIRDADIELLRSQTRSEQVKLYCSAISFVEIFGKLAKKKHSAIEPDAVESGIQSLLESGTFEWVSPSAAALSLAFRLRLKGHADNIDNILYSIASTSRMYFLTLDFSFKNFLSENNYDETILVGLKELSKKIL